MGLQWVYNGYTMGLQWVYNEYTMGLQWVYNRYNMGIQHGRTGSGQLRNGDRTTAKRRVEKQHKTTAR
eukprot:10384101-Heterocapsa_arctica.AAC.1